MAISLLYPSKIGSSLLGRLKGKKASTHSAKVMHLKSSLTLRFLLQGGRSRIPQALAQSKRIFCIFHLHAFCFPGFYQTNLYPQIVVSCMVSMSIESLYLLIKMLRYQIKI